MNQECCLEGFLAYREAEFASFLIGTGMSLRKVFRLIEKWVLLDPINNCHPDSSNSTAFISGLSHICATPSRIRYRKGAVHIGSSRLGCAITISQVAVGPFCSTGN